jgi:hypothetical protein
MSSHVTRNLQYRMTDSMCNWYFSGTVSVRTLTVPGTLYLPTYQTTDLISAFHLQIQAHDLLSETHGAICVSEFRIFSEFRKAHNPLSETHEATCVSEFRIFLEFRKAHNPLSKTHGATCVSEFRIFSEFRKAHNPLSETHGATCVSEFRIFSEFRKVIRCIHRILHNTPSCFWSNTSSSH